MKDQEVLEALQRMRDASKKRNFVQSIDLTINFKGIDFKKAENRVDVEVTMPNPTGKHSEVKTLVFVKDKDFASQLKGKASKIIMDEQIPSLKKKDVEELVSNYNVLLAEGQAILAVGKYLGQQWLDPFMGLVGAALVVHWSRGLLRSSARVLLDLQAPDEVREAIRKSIESEGDNRVYDLHVWSVGPGIYAAEVAIVSSRPLDPDSYYSLLPKELGLVHATFETHLCASHIREAL